MGSLKNRGKKNVSELWGLAKHNYRGVINFKKFFSEKFFSKRTTLRLFGPGKLFFQNFQARKKLKIVLLEKLFSTLKVQGRATITPSNFLDVGCYSVFDAFFVIFRVLDVKVAPLCTVRLTNFTNWTVREPPKKNCSVKPIFGKIFSLDRRPTRSTSLNFYLYKIEIWP